MAIDWSKSPLIARDGMLAWHFPEPSAAANGSSVSSVTDFSGNNRALTATGAYPVLSKRILNSNDGIYFDGTRSPLKYTGSLFARHIFIIASFEPAVFTGNEGLLSDTATFPLLVGAGAGSGLFYNLGYETSAPGYIYRIQNVPLAESAQQAPVQARIAMIELLFPSGIGLDGLQIGQDRGLTGRKWKGLYFESIVYDKTLDDFARQGIYNYAAAKYTLWQQNESGLFVFPFAANHSRGLSVERTFFQSKSYSGASVNLLRSEPKAAYAPAYNWRRESEYLAAKTFHAEHYGIKDFIFRDYKFSTPLDTQVEFTSELSESGNESRFYNYSFSARGRASTTEPAENFGIAISNPEIFVVEG